MNNNRLPKAAMYGHLTQSSRKPGRLLLQFADAIKKDLKSFNISVDNWERIADNHSAS